MVLTDRSHGHEELKRLQERQPGAFKLLCSSVILDDVLRQVRTWARMGYAAAAIQHEIDARYADVLTSEMLALAWQTTESNATTFVEEIVASVVGEDEDPDAGAINKERKSRSTATKTIET